jgi:hypothetical protein
MSRSLVLVVGLTVFVGLGADAQGTNGGLANPDPQCTVGIGTPAQNAANDACQQAFDVYQFLAPQLGLAVAGGNHTLGSGSTLGGLGHFSIGVRGNVFRGSLPKVDEYTQRETGPSPSRELATKRQFIGLPAADLALGVFAGLPLALTNVGGVDLLLSASYVPTIESNELSIKPDRNLQIGYGVRVGLLSESILVPGVSFTFLKRDLPTTTITGSATYDGGGTIGQTTATMNITDAKVKTSGWRLVASKNLLLLGLAAGVGRDKYDQSADIAADVSTTLGSASAVVSNSQSLTRTNYFLDATLNLFLAKLTAEVGRVSGGTVNSYNTFESGRADKSQTYFSAGLRFGF